MSTRRLMVGVLLLVAACSGASVQVSVDEPGASAALAEQTAPAPTATTEPTATPVPVPTATTAPTPLPTPTPTPSPTPVPVAATPCVDGSAAGFPCAGVGLEALVSNADLGARGDEIATDLWGWTNSVTGAEIVIVATTRHTAFVDVTVPARPVVLGVLPHPGNRLSPVNDVKVFADHAFIVGDSRGYGMLVLDLTTLPSTGSVSEAFEPTAHFGDAGAVHNLAIDTDSGFAYLARGSTCDGGLHIVDVREPSTPVSAGCFEAQQVHDAQCLIYAGPDQAYAGREICIGSDESSVAVIDMTDKANPVVISSTTYPDTAYTHQAWLTDDHQFLLVDDEFDEVNTGSNTRTLVFDMSDLDAPVVTGEHLGTTAATDHNQFIAGNHTFQANYRAGLRILELTDLGNGELTEVAFFDTFPASDAANIAGAFGVYPFFDSGVVAVTSMETGLFILRPDPLD